MREKTLLYCTDNTLDDKLFKRVQEILLKAANGLPIISVSQKPIDFGQNICVGEIGRSWLSLYKQQDVGLAAITTPVVSFVEHDVLYTQEHFAFDPPDLETFWYNKNLWLGQWSDSAHPELKGMYSFWPNRTGQSQLIVGRDIALRAYSEREALIEKGCLSRAVPAEPGHKKGEALRMLERLYERASKEGDSRMISGYLKEWVVKWTANYFETKMPNIDIRHGNNFSRGKRGWNRCYELAPWGRLSDILE